MIVNFSLKTLYRRQKMPNISRNIPLNHMEFDRFFKNATQYVAQKTAAPNLEWKHIPKEPQEALIAEYADWYTAYSVTLKPHTPLDTRRKQIAYKKAAKHLRLFINQYLRFPPVTDVDRLALNIRSPDTIRTSRNPPHENVDFFFLLIEKQKLIVHFKAQGATGRAKPHGYHGAVIAWELLDKPPAQLSELTRHVTATRTPYTLEFGEADRGKTIYAAICWQNSKGQNGDWSNIQSAIVP
jgi:hypothetical protein